MEFMRIDNWKFGAVPMAQIVGGFLVIGSITALIVRHRMGWGTRGGDYEEEDEEETRGSSRTAERRRRRRTGLNS